MKLTAKDVAADGLVKNSVLTKKIVVMYIKEMMEIYMH